MYSGAGQWEHHSRVARLYSATGLRLKEEKMGWRRVIKMGEKNRKREEGGGSVGISDRMRPPLAPRVPCAP